VFLSIFLLPYLSFISCGQTVVGLMVVALIMSEQAIVYMLFRSWVSLIENWLSYWFFLLSCVSLNNLVLNES